MKLKNILIIASVILVIIIVFVIGFFYLNSKKVNDDELNDLINQSKFELEIMYLQNNITLDYSRQMVEGKNAKIKYNPSSEIASKKQEIEEKYSVTCNISGEGILKVATTSDTQKHIIDLKGTDISWLE
ncbi:MAG: hypothetical protein N2749_07245 [Clostridia bacterium]|nr:hypothetical protein [Clostridia bacterium]